LDEESIRTLRSVLERKAEISKKISDGRDRIGNASCALGVRKCFNVLESGGGVKREVSE